MTASETQAGTGRELALGDYVTRLGDDSLVLGQRLSEWCGHAPSLELDLSLANLALDLIGQAQYFLGYAAELTGHADADALAYHRDAIDFRNCLLVEQPNGDFGRTIARQFLYSTYQALHFADLAGCADPRLAAIAAKSAKEVAYHATFAREWMVRLGDGTDESRGRIVQGLDWCWRFVDEMFEGEIDPRLQDLDLPGPARCRAAWEKTVDAALAEAGLTRPAPRRAITGGRSGRHSEHLGLILAEMQFLQRAYPGATW